MGKNGAFASLRGLDAFGKTLDPYRVRTTSGALLSLASLFLILTLTLAEFASYRRIAEDVALEVDRSRGEKLAVKIDVTFPRVPCYLLSLDIMDISGEHQDDVHAEVSRNRIDAMGKRIDGKQSAGLKGEAARLATLHGANYCGSCYGGESPNASGCCNTCEDVRTAYAARGWSFTNPDTIDQCVSEHWSEKIKEQATEGCNVAGMIHVNKVVGNFHLSPGRAFQRNNMHVHDLVPYLAGQGKEHHDFGHVINELSFASHEEYTAGLAEEKAGSSKRKRQNKSIKERLGIKDPLTGTKAHTEESQFMFQYFLKVVPTEYRLLSGELLKTHQYSVTSYERDLSPGAQAAAAAGGKPAAGGSKEGHAQVQHGFAGVPGVYINIDPAALKVVHTQRRSSFSHFLTSTCAIVGGILSLAALLDGVLWSARGRKADEADPMALPRSASSTKSF